ncbi:hypothetical protein L227DRAFT_607760 [Lentinus tigrinus ALCF2SS1-6]|uniref:VPS9 domain-containing protein n=1 Tax=Lentinus tigrinus ALCF2SS1-6 TaxID=1328759 RepID=A0A5C2SJQ0_9APHY|nr:hypothetical protein L227DRAFT_607760 [Lentinus tigrinus ALCF2SS1-6]
MSTRRDNLFPVGSIGRSGVSVPRTASHESLTAHPLLSPPAASASFSPSSSPSTSTAEASAAIPAPKYVPYTPRQRGAISPATTTPVTGTTSHPIPPDRDAANRLQLMHLKAAAQKVGLDAASTGWAILEKFALETERTAEWNDLWSAVTESKATLLLPKDQHPSNVLVTAEFIKDHVAICDASAGSRTTSVTTLSGLRGYITDNVLTFRTTLSPTSKPFQALLTPSTRASAFTSLAPLPRPLSSSPPTPVDGHHHRHHSRSAPPYPAFVVQAHTSSLPLPPRPSANVKGPPLPPRPGARQTFPAPSGSSTGARLSNPFASLFGRANTSSPPPPASPTTSTSALPATTELTSSPGGSTPPSASPGIAATEHATAFDIPAYVISGRIQRNQVLGAMANALRGELEDVLAGEGVPQWAQERVVERTQWLGPVVYGGKSSPLAGTDGRRRVSGVGAGPGRVRGAGGSDGSTWEVAGELTDSVDGGGIEEVARRLQEFWYDLEEEVGNRWAEDVAQHGHKGRWRRHGKASSGSEGESGTDKDNERDSEKEKEASDSAGQGHDDEQDSPKTAHVNRVMDAVEKTVCSLFYDRLFLPPGTDDASHDEALSSRIAAVNLLDLGLGHLGVEVGRAGREVDALIKACGQTLMQLDSVCRSPADKAATLVSVHKILVDGLSKLPPLRLKAEDEILEEKTPVASSFGKSVRPDDDELDRAVSPPPTVVVSPISNSPIAELQPITATEKTALLTPDNASGTSESSTNASASPILTVSPPPEPSSASPSPAPTATPVSGDIILPLMIFAVVKTNPPHLVSHLLFTQRFRREHAAGGEEGYCLINLMAVAEFLENVDLAALGLGESEKMVIRYVSAFCAFWMFAKTWAVLAMRRAILELLCYSPSLSSTLRQLTTRRGQASGGASYCQRVPLLLFHASTLRSVHEVLVLMSLVSDSTAELTPIPISRPGSDAGSPRVPQSSLRGRVEQQVDALAGSANKVLTGVVDTSFGVLRALLPGQASEPNPDVPTPPIDADQSAAPWNITQPRFGLLRRDTHFSIASIAASLPGRSKSVLGEEGQQMIDVPSRPGSSRSVRPDDQTPSEESSEEDEEDEEEEEEEGYDTRSIRSFESMMSQRSRQARRRKTTGGRKSLADRLASVPGLSRLSQGGSGDGTKLSPPGSRRSSLLVPPHGVPKHVESPTSSRAQSPVAIRISPPNARFMACTEDDIKVSEVGELLREYKRLVEAVRAMGGFYEE